MKITTGLFDRMVVQRNRNGVSDASFSGTCEAVGPLLATVYRGKRAVKELSGIKAGNAVDGFFSGCLKGVPAGGPYEIRLEVGKEKLTIRDVLVGDVWLLGGQSNMQGCGNLPAQPAPADPLVRAFYMDDHWDVAKDPVHQLWTAVDPVHLDLLGGVLPEPSPGKKGASPGPAFGREMRRLTGVPQGLICCAHGGTKMEQWDPALKDHNGKSLYGAMLRRFVKNGARVAGLLWYQGCSDALPECAVRYSERMITFVAELRKDTGQKSLPVGMVQIGRVMDWGGGSSQAVAAWNSIQEQQRMLPAIVKNLTIVPTIDLTLDDFIHISGEGHQILGVRLARAMRVLQVGPKAGLPPITLKSIKAVVGKRGLGDVLVKFSNVSGALRAGSRPAGFSITDVPGYVFDVKLEGSVARLKTTVAKNTLEQASVHYGRGLDPYCNIIDRDGRSLPVFGPVPMSGKEAGK